MGIRLLTMGLIMALATGTSWATVPMTPQPMLSFLTVEEEDRRHHVSYVLLERNDGPVDGTEISRERSSNGLWYQFQAGNGFRLDLSLQHIHEVLSDPASSAELRSPEVARFGTGLSGGLGWTIPISQWRDDSSGWSSAVGLHLGTAGFFSLEGDRFAPFSGDGQLLGYTASGALGFELSRESWWGLHDLRALVFLEATPLVQIESQDLPLESFEDGTEATSPLGWGRAGVAVQLNWSDENPTPIILSYSLVFDPVDQQTIGLGLVF